MAHPDILYARSLALGIALCSCLALAACGPLPAPTAALSPTPLPVLTTVPQKAAETPLRLLTESPRPAPSTETAPASPAPTLPPTPTPLPTATPSPRPTALPPWPTAGPTPTAASALLSAMQTAAFFFYWHECPGWSCNSNIVYALPPGWAEPFPADPDSRDGVYYSSLNAYWYLQEVRDMHLAGIDVILPVSWGDTPYPWFDTAALAGLVEANRAIDPPLRIGLFDDTSSEVSEYNDFLDNQQFDGSAWTLHGAPLDLSDPAAGFFFYDRKIKPYFQAIPQEMWATHDGRPLEEGGRPLIVVYTRSGLAHLEYAGQLWAGVKASFARDFRDGNGNPLTPFVILESSWFSGEALSGSPSVDTVADGRYTWGATLLGPRWHTHAGYTAASVGVGFDDRKNVDSTNRLQRRDYTVDGREGGPGAWLESSFARIPASTDLLLVETWNELYEGTNICRVTYPEIADQFVPEDYYIGLLRRLLRGQDLWWGAQPLPPSWPAHLERGRSYRLDFPVENTGARTWTAEEGVYLLVQGELFPSGYQAWPAEPVRPGDVAAFNVPLTAPSREGTYQVTWQMVSPAGPLGPAVSWALPVESGAVTTTLRVAVPPELPAAGEPVTLTIALDPPAQVASVRMRLRFDPAALSLEGVYPLAGQTSHWRVEVDNEQGEVALELQVAAPAHLGGLVLIRLGTHAAGASGLWIEQAEVRLRDGALQVLPARWVPLEIAAARER